MTSIEHVMWCTVLGVVMSTAGVLCASAPLQDLNDAAGPLEQRARPVTPRNPVPPLMRAVMPQNPAPAPPIVVALRVTLDEQGRVGEVRPLGPGRERYSFYVSRPMGAEVLAFTPIMDRMPPRPDDYKLFVNAAMNAVRQWRYERPRNGPIVFNVVLGFDPWEVRLLSNGVTADETAPPSSRAIPPEPIDVRPDWAQGAVRIGNDLKRPVKVKDVAALYPPIAQSARVQGVVTLDVRVEPDGHVSSAQVVEGPPLLRRAAFDAVRQWEFTPTILDGRPVPALITVTLEFKLMH